MTYKRIAEDLLKEKDAIEPLRPKRPIKIRGYAQGRQAPPPLSYVSDSVTPSLGTELMPPTEPPVSPFGQPETSYVSDAVTAQYTPELAEAVAKKRKVEEEVSFSDNPTYWLWKRKLLPDFFFSSMSAQNDIKRGEQGLSYDPSLAKSEQKVESLRRQSLANDPNPVIRFANTPTVVGGLTPSDMAGIVLIISIGSQAVSRTRPVQNLMQRLSNYKLSRVQQAQFSTIDKQTQKIVLDVLDDVLQENPGLAERATPKMVSRICNKMHSILEIRPRFNMTANARYGLVGDIPESNFGKVAAKAYAKFALEWGGPQKPTLVVDTLKSAGYSSTAIQGMSVDTAWANLQKSLGNADGITILLANLLTLQEGAMAMGGTPKATPGGQLPSGIPPKVPAVGEVAFTNFKPSEIERFNELFKKLPDSIKPEIKEIVFNPNKGNWYREGIVGINRKSFEEGTFYHEIGHSIYTDLTKSGKFPELLEMGKTWKHPSEMFARNFEQYMTGKGNPELRAKYDAIFEATPTIPKPTTVKPAIVEPVTPEVSKLWQAEGRTPQDTVSMRQLPDGRFQITPSYNEQTKGIERQFFTNKEEALAELSKRGEVKEYTRPTPEVTPQVPEPAVTAPEPTSAEVPIEVKSAVVEVAGSPPKPPKDWDKIGSDLYDRFKKQGAEPTPSTVPLSNRMAGLWPKLEKITNDELARLNWLGWQAEVDSAMVRASGGQAAQLYRETMKAINKSLNGDSNLVSYVDDYLMLRHQLEVLKATGRKYFTIKKGDKTQRFTAKQIGLLFAQMNKELGADYAKVKEAAAHVPAVYNQIMKGTQELTQEQIEGLIKKYPWYNPILFEKETTPVNITSKLTPRQIKQLTTLESDKQQVSPLMSLPTTIAKRMKAQAINEARRSVSEAAIDPKNKALVGGDVEVVIKKPEGAFIDYFDKGQRKYLKLGKGAEWLAKDIELIQTQPSGVVVSMVRSLQNLSKMAFTTYNPGFMAWNTAFDGMVAYYSEGIGPLEFSKAFVDNVKALFVDVPSVNEFRRAGGEMMGFFGKGVEEMGITQTPKGFLAKEKGRLVLKNPESLKRFINPFEIIRELGLTGENAGRKAAFDKAIKEGLSPKEAALRGRRVTVDFSRFSAASRHINNWFIYFNPALQGFYLPGRAIAKDPRTLWRLAVLVAGYTALTVYNQSYEEYQDVRDNDKVGKLLIMLPSNEYDKYGKKVPHYITLLPFREFALFTAPIEYMMGKLRAEEPEAYRTWGQELGTLYSIVSPLSMISETGGLVMPTQIAATMQQIIQNYDDFRNKPIVDDEMALLPTSQQYDQYTDKLAIKIGQALNMSPKKLDFFVSNMFGAIGRDFLRTIDLAIQGIDREQVDERIAGLVNDLRSIQTNVPPDRITVARETFLEGLSVEDRELVLNMERLPDEQIPFITSIFQRYYRDYGGQVYQTAKEKALAGRTLEDYPSEALENLQKEANQNAQNFLDGKINNYQYDQNRSRYRAYYSGGTTAEWREAMKEGGVSQAEIDKYMPESYKRSEEFQAVSAYMEIREKHINDAGGVFDSDTWDRIEQLTLAELGHFYSQNAIEYALQHKDDWIDKLPEPARSIERNRAVAIEDGSWWDNYRGTSSHGIPSTIRGYGPSGSKSHEIPTTIRGYGPGGSK